MPTAACLLAASILGLNVVAALAQTNQPKNEEIEYNYLSLQHPEWPPLAEPPGAGIKLEPLSTGEFAMHDLEWKYKSQPAVATNRLAMWRLKNDDAFRLDTNYFAKMANQRVLLEMNCRALFHSFHTNLDEETFHALYPDGVQKGITRREIEISEARRRARTLIALNHIVSSNGTNMILDIAPGRSNYVQPKTGKN